MKTCVVCGNEFDGREDAKYCSSKCRVKASRNSTIDKIEDNVIIEEPKVLEDFKFKCPNTRTNSGYWEDDGKVVIRTAKYWYDVPVCAVPIIGKGEPEMPDWMDGRIYFLWRKNEFKVSESGKPVIINPYPKHDNVTLHLGGETARMWSNR